MSGLKKHEDFDLLRGGRDNSQRDLGLPMVPSMIVNPDGTLRDDGLVPRSVLNNDLEFFIPEWISSEEFTEYVRVGWRREGEPFFPVGEVYEFPQPIPSGEKVVVVPLNNLVEGRYDLSYQLIVLNNVSESLKRKVRIDRTTPNDGQRPPVVIFPDELQGVITDQYLADHGEVRVRVQGYIGVEAFDCASYFWTDSEIPMEGEEALGEHDFTKLEVDNNQMFLTYSAADIRRLGSGRRYAYYRLRDLAGNVNPNRSMLSSIQVDLTPMPVDLPPPRIPLSGRGVIDREHARSGAVNEGGVTVEIDRYENPENNHFILVNWHGTELSEHRVDVNEWPQRIYVPWSTLVARGLGPLDVQVTYRVRVGPVFTARSDTNSAPVDFTVAGQDHANAPAQLNTLLAVLEVRGAHSDTPNRLTALDEGEDASVTFRLFDNPNVGETIFLFWGAIELPVAEYTVRSGDVTGQTVRLTVPWSAIEQDKNNPALPVYYLTDNGVNQQQSRVTSVAVSVELLRGLKSGSFPHVTTFGYLNCCSVPRLWAGVTVHIDGTEAGNAHLAAGDTVELMWKGFAQLNGTVPIPGVAETFSLILDDQQAINGFDVVIGPYDRLIAPMVNNGSGTAQYRLLKAGGGIGLSDRSLVKISRTLPSGEVCSPTNDVCVAEGE